MGYDFTKAVANLAKGCRLRRDGDDGWEMVMPVPNPDGATIDRLMREGWLEMMPNGGTAKISDAGLKAYLRATDEMGRGVLEMTPQKTKVPTCPDCGGLCYLGGEGTDVPSSCMNNFHKLTLDESFERVVNVAKERDAFNQQAELKDRKEIVAWLRKQYDREIAAMQSKWAWNDLIFHEAKAIAYDHAANEIEGPMTAHPLTLPQGEL